MLTRFFKKFIVNSSRIYLDRFCERAGKTLRSTDLVLDAGAGKAPYKKHFAHAKYESADFCEVNKPYYDSLTHVCSLESIPVEDSRYDAVILTQVLEHIPEPQVVLAELNLVTKSGGKLWLTVPLFYPEHEQPYDFFRYTQFSLTRLCEQAGYELEEIEWLEGYFGTLGFQMEFVARNIPIFPSPNKSLMDFIRAPVFLILRLALTLLAIWFYRLDLTIKLTTSRQCKNYALIAIKK